MARQPAPKKALKVAITYDFDERLGYFLKADIIQAFSRQQIELVPLFYLTEELHKLDSVDGLVLPGGLLDVDPALYGQTKKYESVKILKNRAEFEFQVLDRFVPTQRPLLAICWGMQLLNVYRGGSLFQHLPADRPSKISHEQTTPSTQPSHSVEFVSGTKIPFGNSRLKVNSTHHQGVDRIGKNLELRGTAEDGLVECVCDPLHPYLWAVQWHPERLIDDPVIPSFAEACRRQD